MALKNKISILDRNVSGIEGPPVGQNPPSDGMYFTGRGTSDSPFDTVRGPKMDQMVQLLTKNVKSDNSGQTYTPSPNQSPFQDLDGDPGPEFQLERSAASKKHIDSLTKTSTYTHGNSTEVVGPTPGGDSNSPFQDLNGEPGRIFGNAGGEGKKLGSVDLHVGLLTKGYTYGHAPGYHTTVLGENERGHEGGKFDLDSDGNDIGNGIFTIGKLQGKQLGGKDLHEALLTKAHTYSHGGGRRIGTTPVTVGPSPGPSGFSDFQDLDGGFASPNPILGQFGGPYNTTGPKDGFY